MIITGIQIIETLLYAYLIICVGYLALFAFAALFAKEKKIPSTDQYARMILRKFFKPHHNARHLS